MLAPIIFALLLWYPGVFAQDYFTGLLQAFNASGLTQLGALAPLLNSSSVGQQIISELPNGNWTLFAPDNAAFASVNSSALSNATSVADIISYHIVSGNFTNETASSPNVTIGRTLLNDTALVKLEGNQSQVLAWTKLSNGSFSVFNQNTTASVVNTTQYSNLQILVIDSVLIPPPNISTVLNNSVYSLSSLAQILPQITLSGSNGSYIQTISNATGITIFAPDNDAIQTAKSNLGSTLSNTTALTAILQNHVINGTSAYTPFLIPSGNWTSAAGESLTTFTNSSGLFVTSGGSVTAQIIRSDVLTENGVIHIVNNVLVDTQTNASAASSAYVSATSVAAESTTQTGPVGPATSTSSSG